jgi:hypothetical protein
MTVASLANTRPASISAGSMRYDEHLLADTGLGFGERGAVRDSDASR